MSDQKKEKKEKVLGPVGGLKMQLVQVVCTLQRDLLGGKSSKLASFVEYQAALAPTPDKTDEEIKAAQFTLEQLQREQAEADKAAADAGLVIEKPEDIATTVFHRHPDNAGIFVDAYMFKGFLKEAADTLRVVHAKSENSRWGAAKNKVSKFVHVFPDRLMLLHPEDHADPLENVSDRYVKQPAGHLTRPLRAETAQGSRVALARSELVRAGVQFEAIIGLIGGDTFNLEMLTECLKLGSFTGLGQWRNAGFGRFHFDWRMLDIDAAKEFVAKVTNQTVTRPEPMSFTL